MKTLFRLRKNQDGATAIEYGLIAGLIAVVIIGGATLAGGNLSSTFDSLATSLDSSSDSSGS